MRRGGREIALGQGKFLDGLEEFEALPLNRQRRMLEKDLLKVNVDSGSVFGDILHLNLNVSYVGCGVRVGTYR